jgi:hypothetical protein
MFVLDSLSPLAAAAAQVLVEQAHRRLAWVCHLTFNLPCLRR